MRDITPQLNVLSVLGIFVIVGLASVFEFAYHELPCPLCLLQRLGFLGMSLGFLMNLRFGTRARYYAVSLFFALFTSAVAIRQILLHIVPGTGSYGFPVFGLHLYTWVFILAVLYIIWIGINMLFEKNFTGVAPINRNRAWKVTVHTLFALVVALCIFESVTVLFECGLCQCPENPAKYKLLQ